VFIGLLKTLRPRQWIKNLFVGVPLFFAQRLGDTEALWRVVAAFALFCAVSGAVYVINDLVDVDKDRAHPKKKDRPIASGRVSVVVARAYVALAVPVALAVGAWLHPLYAAALATYFAVNLAYCFKIKQVAYLDVVSIAIGFVLRLLSGAFVIDVQPSPWLLVETALLSMFLGFGKRAHELGSRENATTTRPSLEVYDSRVLRVVLYSLAIATAGVYVAYTRSEHVATTFTGAPLWWTIPFPIVGILRFVHLVTTRHAAESPTEEMLRDPLFMGNFVAWLIVTGLLVYHVW
jgi:4-hydroxybenzoate polyprenyltransferase